MLLELPHDSDFLLLPLAMVSDWLYHVHVVLPEIRSIADEVSSPTLWFGNSFLYAKSVAPSHYAAVGGIILGPELSEKHHKFRVMKGAWQEKSIQAGFGTFLKGHSWLLHCEASSGKSNSYWLAIRGNTCQC